MKYKILIMVALIWLGLSCSKKDKIAKPSYDYSLPPVTASGNNTAGFLLNGKVFTPLGNPAYERKLKFEVYDAGFRLKMIRIESNIKYEFRLVSDVINGVGVYEIKPETNANRIYFSKSVLKADGSTYENVCTSEYWFLSKNNATGTITITKFDRANSIFSGEFEVQFSNYDCEMDNPFVITQGRFDMKSLL